MNETVTIVVSALVVGVIAVVVGAGYTSATASKLPERMEMIQLFASGSIVGGFVSWLVASGVMHGSSFMNMVSSDLSSTMKDMGLKGGETPAAPAAASNMGQMVGGFFNSIGLDKSVLQELKVGMPTW
jgi:hypothetical protein